MSIIKNGNKIAGNYKIQVATEATTEKSGAIRIATEDEAKAGILDNVAITPKQLGEVASSIDIPPATQETIGLVKPDGETIVVDESGTISAVLSEEYDLPTASTTTLGGVKVDGETIIITEDGTLSADIPEVALATLTSAGLVQPDGTSISILNGVISAVAQGGDEWTYKKATSGYIKHTSGIIIQWGITDGVNESYSSYAVCTFPTPFTIIPAVTTTPTVTNIATVGHAMPGSNISTTGFRLNVEGVVLSKVHWIAIGY